MYSEKLLGQVNTIIRYTKEKAKGAKGTKAFQVAPAERSGWDTQNQTEKALD